MSLPPGSPGPVVSAAEGSRSVAGREVHIHHGSGASRQSRDRHEDVRQPATRGLDLRRLDVMEQPWWATAMPIFSVSDFCFTGAAGGQQMGAANGSSC